MKKLIALTLTLLLCLLMAACAPTDDGSNASNPTETQPNASTEADATRTPVETTRQTQPVITQPAQNMCYWCDEVPVGDFETYCVNCRCLKCDKLRKSGGSYLYCSSHNCNESLCEYPAFEDSQYCSEHKCSQPNCDNRRWPGSQYCAHHK